MPFVTLRFLKGRSPDQKVRLLKDLTEVISRNLEVDASRINIILQEVVPENWAVNGLSFAETSNSEEAEDA